MSDFRKGAIAYNSDDDLMEDTEIIAESPPQAFNMSKASNQSGRKRGVQFSDDSDSEMYTRPKAKKK